MRNTDAHIRLKNTTSLGLAGKPEGSVKHKLMYPTAQAIVYMRVIKRQNGTKDKRCFHKYQRHCSEKLR